MFNNNNQSIEKIALDTLERYSGSSADQFCSYLLLTNFSVYINTFAEMFNVPVIEGSMFTTAHAPDIDISIVNFKLGSPAAALIIDVCSFIPNLKATLMLGMCGGLRRHYHIGDYFIPVAAIRGEGTSDFYFSPEVPAMANFLIQKGSSEVLEQEQTRYHVGIIHTTNIRFWEFNDAFKEQLRDNKAQAIDMECATLFCASYRRKLPLGALLLISDLPLMEGGVKTKKSSQLVFDKYTKDHLEKGILTIKNINQKLLHKEKGAYRGKMRDIND